MIRYMQAVFGAVEPRQWLWFGAGAAVLLVSDRLYSLRGHPVVQGRAVRCGIWKKLLLIYTGFILMITLFTRESSLQGTAAPVPFWSWAKVICNHNTMMLYQILLNMLLFVPFGGLLKLAYREIRLPVGWILGLLLSMAIEVCQLVFHLGLFEWDDMLHNSVGCLVGSATVKAILWVLTNKRQG